MECPKCRRDVETIHGNGKYPNSSYKCSKCYDDDTGRVVTEFIALFLWGVLIAVCLAEGGILDV